MTNGAASQAPMTTKKRRAEKFALRVVRGGYQPADSSTAARLRDKGHRVGDIVFAQITRPRNPRFHRLAHAFGRLVAENIDAFAGMESHKVLKRIQLEANIGCEEVAYQLPGNGMIIQRIPHSLSFESMDEGEFRSTYRGMCRHIAQMYWPDLGEDEIAQMAELMVDE